MVSVAKTHRCKCGGLRHKCDVVEVQRLTAEVSRLKVEVEDSDKALDKYWKENSDLKWYEHLVFRFVDRMNDPAEGLYDRTGKYYQCVFKQCDLLHDIVAEFVGEVSDKVTASTKQ